ncbi:hypothetical protein RIF29_17192 [Crotalaria pallida]|uniref:Exocyst subunit Exo70 family protein n=1 Tax=Crotalaria pallida TaxID=3830 RepID=A0AAN9FMG3_CROPI
MMPVSIQIPNIVGFVAAVVGLLCYALSSSFNHLFGNWNFLKIFIYFIFSFTVCFVPLFAKKRRRSTSPQFKTHMAVLVLIATNVYSFYYDRAVNEKPDAYILISCLAFAVMCFSLSRQTQCGCEPDLANFFLGCLITLLLKISLWLFFVGAVFCYSLVAVIFRFASDEILHAGFSGDYVAIPVDLLEAETNNVHVQLDPRHVNSDSVIQIDSLQRNGNGARIVALTRFKACISALQRESEIILRELHTYAEKYLEDSAFYVGHPISHVPTDENLLIDSLPPETINSLHEAVNLMVATGFEEVCCHVYSRCRRQFIKSCLLRLQLSDFNDEGFHPSVIQKWMKACYVALRILFPWERRLCDRVFAGFSSAADQSFTEVCRELTNDLINFHNKLAIESLSSNYFDRSLKVFQIFRDLIPEFESVFSDDCSVSLKNEAITNWERLARLFFIELENHICRRHMVSKASPYERIIDTPMHYATLIGYESLIELLMSYYSVFKLYKEFIWGWTTTKYRYHLMPVAAGRRSHYVEIVDRAPLPRGPLPSANRRRFRSHGHHR